MQAQSRGVYGNDFLELILIRSRKGYAYVQVYMNMQNGTV